MEYMVNESSKNFLDNLINQNHIVQYLNDLHTHHKESYEHSCRVALLSIDLGYENYMMDDELETLGYAGLLHDLGKTTVDQDILTKASSLKREERAAIDSHPRNGFMKLEDPKIRKIVVGHHEYHTSSYPRSGKDRRIFARAGTIDRRRIDPSIKTLTQIVAIADMYDALASPRAYKEPFTQKQIRTILFENFTGDQKFIRQIMARSLLEVEV